MLPKLRLARIRCPGSGSRRHIRAVGRIRPDGFVTIVLAKHWRQLEGLFT